MVPSKDFISPSEESSDAIHGEDQVMIRYLSHSIMTLLDIHTHSKKGKPTQEAILNLPPEALSYTEEPFLDGNYYYSVGIHPKDINEKDSQKQLERLSIVASHSSIIAIGESGLDKRVNSPLSLQIDVYKATVDLANRLKLPLIIHCVKAIDELLSLKKENLSQTPWIIHGFRGKKPQMEQLLKHGFYLSFGVRYHEDCMKEIPIDRLFLETDEADININELLGKAARIKAIEIDELRSKLEDNILKVFFKR